MRRLLFFIACCVPAASSCVTTDPAPLYADVNYQVRCIDCEPRAVDDAPHHITALDGEKGFDIACTTHSISGGRLVTFNASLIDSKHPTSTYAFKILQANVDKKDPGSSCRVQIVEGNNTYEGTCTSGEPTTDAPCQLKISDVKGSAKGSVLCAELPNRNDMTVTRHLVKPDTSDPAPFEIQGCPGL